MTRSGLLLPEVLNLCLKLASCLFRRAFEFSTFSPLNGTSLWKGAENPSPTPRMRLKGLPKKPKSIPVSVTILLSFHRYQRLTDSRAAKKLPLPPSPSSFNDAPVTCLNGGGGVVRAHHYRV